MDLRDELAIQRTILANQRTLLSFFTASLAIAVGGVTLIKFFPGHWSYWAGWVLLPLSVVVLIYGFKNYFAHRQAIDAAKGRADF